MFDVLNCVSSDSDLLFSQVLYILDDDNLAEDRIRRPPTEEHMVLVEGTLQSPVDSAPAEADGELKFKDTGA